MSYSNVFDLHFQGGEVALTPLGRFRLAEYPLCLKVNVQFSQIVSLFHTRSKMMCCTRIESPMIASAERFGQLVVDVMECVPWCQ